MNKAMANQWGERPKAESIEHIELREPSMKAAGLRTGARIGTDRRLSNRVQLPNIKGSALFKKDYFNLWQHVREFPCRIINLSFGGVRIESPLRLREGQLIELEVRLDSLNLLQIIPVTIHNTYKFATGTNHMQTGYGGSIESTLDAGIRRLIVQSLTT